MKLPKIQKPLSDNLKSNIFCQALYQIEEKVAAKFGKKYGIDTNELLGLSNGMEKMLTAIRSNRFTFPDDPANNEKMFLSFLNRLLENSIQDAILKRRVEHNRFNYVDNKVDDDGNEIDVLEYQMPQDISIDPAEQEAATLRLIELCEENGIVYEETDDEYSLKYKLSKAKSGYTINTAIWEYVNDNGFVSTDEIAAYVKGKIPKASMAGIKVAISQCRNSGKDDKGTAISFAKKIWKPTMTFSDFVFSMSSRDVHIKTLTKLWGKLQRKEI